MGAPWHLNHLLRRIFTTDSAYGQTLKVLDLPCCFVPSSYTCTCLDFGPKRLSLKCTFGTRRGTALTPFLSLQELHTRKSWGQQKHTNPFAATGGPYPTHRKHFGVRVLIRRFHTAAERAHHNAFALNTMAHTKACALRPQKNTKFPSHTCYTNRSWHFVFSTLQREIQNAPVIHKYMH